LLCCCIVVGSAFVLLSLCLTSVARVLIFANGFVQTANRLRGSPSTPSPRTCRQGGPHNPTRDVLDHIANCARKPQAEQPNKRRAHVDQQARIQHLAPTEGNQLSCELRDSTKCMPWSSHQARTRREHTHAPSSRSESFDDIVCEALDFCGWSAVLFIRRHCGL
jgi:hypothetical protein